MDFLAPLLAGEWVSSSVAVIVTMMVAGFFVTGIGAYVSYHAFRARRDRPDIT